MAISEEIQRQVLAEATSATPNYSIDYSDPRFGNVESDKKQALSDLEQTYAGMIGQASGFYQDQIDNLEKWEDEQIALKDQQLAFEEQKINQQKEQAHKDYLKEQSASYVDWQKQSNKYGTNAEQMASAGLTATGFAESSQVSMYNTYQIRVATARESFERAKLNYDNLIMEARLENNAAKAELAFQTLQKSLELSLAGFQYENELLREKVNKKTELDNMYYNRYQDVLEQINHENAVKEDIRQYNETMAWNKQKAEDDRKHTEKMAEIEYNYQVKRDEATREFEAAQAVLDRQHEIDVINAKTDAEKAIIDKEWEIEQERLKVEQANALAKINAERDAEIALLDHKASLEQKEYDTVVTNTRNPNNRSLKDNGTKPGTSTGYAMTSPKTTDYPINTQSVVALGYGGAISGSKLMSLVESGEVLTYVKNGQRYFSKNPMYHKTKYSFGGQKSILTDMRKMIK